MDHGRRRFLAASALAPLVLNAACSGQPPLTRVGGISWIGYAPLFLARELGLYDDAILRLVEIPSNTANLMALATGDVEAATLTLDECLLGREGGLDVRAVLVFDYSAGADVILARPGIQRLEEVRGKRVGIEETAAGALMLAKLLEAAGLTPADIEKVRVTADRHLQAYLGDEVDVLATWEPIATQLQAQGARRLLDSSAFPGLIVDVLVARAEALEQAPDNFRRLLAGYFQALDHLRRAPDDACRKMAPRLGIRPDEVKAALGGLHFVDLADNRKWLGGGAPALATAAHKVGRIMAAGGLLKHAPQLDGLADPGFLPEA